MFCACVGGRKVRGAEWVRVDFHLHSPNSKTFSLPAGVNLNSKSDIENIAEHYVKRLKGANIKLASITDYNLVGKDWFELIKKKAEENGIIILPGIELDIAPGIGGKYGLHVLFIFDRDEDVEKINRLIYSFDKDPQNDLVKNDGHRSLRSRHDLEELISEIKNKFNCITIFPHPEDDKGIFKSFKTEQAASYLKNIKPDAIEWFRDSTRRRLLATGIITEKDLDRIAQIESSDPKSLEEIGNKTRDGKKRATYLKLSDYSIDAIKLALHDPSIRVRLYSYPKLRHNYISEMVVRGSNFLKDLRIKFNPEMNTLIGGRGVGKSAIIETIRYGLGLPIFSEQEYRTNFVHDVVGSGGVIEISVQVRYGEKAKVYKVKRTIGKELEIYDEHDNKLQIDISALFDNKVPVVIGQKELYYVAKDSDFRRNLIDELIGEDVKKKQKDIDTLIDKLKVNSFEIVSLKGKLSKKEELIQELKSINEEIRIYEQLGVAEKLRSLTDCIDDDQLVEDGYKKFNDLIEKVNELINYVNNDLNILQERLNISKTGHKSIVNLKEIYKELREHLLVALNGLLEDISSFKRKYENAKEDWREYKKSIERKVEEVKRELGKKDLKPEKLEELARRRAFLEPRIQELERLEEELNKKLAERNDLKSRLKMERHKLFEIRQRKVEEINKKLKGRLKLEVKFEDDRSEFEKRLRSLLKGSRVSQTAINNIVTSKLAIDGLLLSEYIQRGKEEIMSKFNLTETMAENFVSWFKDDERLFQLETLFPEDRIIIKLNVNEDFKDIEKLSDGQKATALLLLLFAQEDRILILDQPEEDLDNRFIYEDVVKILRDYKSKRQFIIATHNANIPVIGDSELIVVLESAEGVCNIVDLGSIDKASIREHVKNIMEGGEEAFRLRFEKYGGL